MHQYFTNILISLINLVTSLYIIRELSSIDFGEYSFLISFVTIASYLGNFGFPGLMQKYLPKMSKKDSIVFSNQLLYIKMAFIFSISIILFSVNSFLTIINPHYFLILLFIILFNSINSFILHSYFIIMLQHSFVYKNLFLMAVLKLSIVFILLRFNIFSIKNVLYLLLFYEGFLALLVLYKYNIYSYYKYFKLKNIFSDSIFFIKEKLFELLFIPAFSIIYLKTFYTLEEVAKYSFIISISLLITGNVSILSRIEVIINNIVISHGKADEHFYFINTIWYKFFLLVTIPAVSIIFINLHEISHFIFNDKYESVIFLLPITISFLFLSHITYLYSSLIYLKNDLYVFSKNSFIAGISHLVLLFILGYLYSYIGAIIAFLLSYNIRALNLILVYGNVVNLVDVAKSFIKILLIVSIVLSVISKILIINNVLSLIGSSVILFIFIIFVLLNLKIFSKKEIDFIKQIKKEVK